MVIKFSSASVDPPVMLYMGVDKVENEELIRWGWPEDVWFHVDKVSSAHVYVRLPEGMTFDSMPEALITDCAQLVKANSIEGNKMNNIEVVYTPWENLKKTGDMNVGQVGFHNEKRVKHVKVEKRVNEIVNRLNKTMRKGDIDYRETRDAKERQKLRAAQKAQKEREKAEAEEAEKLRRQRNYEDLEDTNVTSNMDAGNLSDDFM